MAKAPSGASTLSIPLLTKSRERGPPILRSASLPYRHRAVFYRPSADGSKLGPVPSGTGLRRPFLSHRYFFIVVRLLRRRAKFTEPDFALLARAFKRVGARRRLAPTEHAVNQRRGVEGELWQLRFFDRALRCAKEYNEKVEYIHLNPVRAVLVSRPEGWSRPAGSSYNEYAGMSAGESVSRRTV